MSRANPWILTAALLGLLAIFAGPGLIRGEVFVNQHEGDLIHLLDMLFRVERGEVPHLDFMTPIGGLALWPITAFLGDGTGVGQAFLMAQASIAAVLLPALVWIGWTRLSTLAGIAFGGSVILLATALVHGETTSALSVSMHYNRWAWAVAFVALAVAVLPPRRTGAGAEAVDGAILGLAFAALALIKVTYVVAFAPVALAALLMRRQATAAAVATVAGLSVAAAVTVTWGFGYWLAYLADIRAVSASEVRGAPGLPLNGILAGPAYIGATVVTFGAAFVLRRSGEARGGMLMLLCIPGFALVTWQNWGNDPQWLYLVPILLLALRPDAGRTFLGQDARGTLTLAATAAAAFALPSMVTLAMSGAQNAAIDAGPFQPLLPDQPDLSVLTARAETTRAVVPYDPVGWGEAPEDEEGGEDDVPRIAEFRGEALPDCMLNGGTMRTIRWTVADLERAGIRPESAIFTADLFSPYWFFGEFRPTRGGAAWYYGGLPGLADADYVLVPLCPVFAKARDVALAALDAEGTELTETSRTPLYVLYATGGSGTPQIARGQGGDAPSDG